MRTTVRALRAGSEGGVSKGALTVDKVALGAALRADDQRIGAIEVDLASPGDSTRLLCVKDVVEPRTRTDGAVPGHGRVIGLRGVAVVTCGPIVGFQEGIIDMRGPGADHTPFSRLHLVVLRIKVDATLAPHEHEEVVRRAGLRAADLLARVACDAPGDDVNTFDLSEAAADLPRLAYVYLVLNQGLLHDTWVEGRKAPDGLPCLVDPRLPIETGIVSGNCVSACDKNTTWHHQNNPVVLELLRGHGKRWNFTGVVLASELTRLAEKEASAARTIELVQSLDAAGVVITKEGFGNPDADLMMIIRGLEQRGVRTVAITDEFAGGDGASQSLADATPEADAIVSTGNANERIVLPAMERVLGPINDVERLAGAGANAVRGDGGIEVELQAIMGATNQFGCQMLTCVEV